MKWEASTWEYVTKNAETGIKINTLNSNNLTEMINWVEEFLSDKTHSGYTMIIKGSCCKAPQGIWWDAYIFFEDEIDRDWLVAKLNGLNLVHRADRERVT